MASLKSRRSYKVLLALVGGLSALAIAISLYLGGVIFVLEKTNIDITECFTSSWHKVDVCSKSPNYVSLNTLPDHLKWAVLLAEDASFYQHSGFDWFEIQKSIDANLEKRAYVRGGSTITQQLAKNAFLSGKKSILRKLKEAYLTQKLEKSFKKNQILEAYVNVVELGEGVFGFGSASWHYFQRHVSQLSPTQSAFLASLLPSPRTYQSYLYKNSSLHPAQMDRVRRIVNLLIRHQKIPDSYQDVMADREAFGFWPSFIIWPSDDLLHRPILEANPFEIVDFEDSDIGLNEEPSADPLDSPIGEEDSQQQEDTQVN